MELDGIVELGKLVHLTDQEMDTISFCFLIIACLKTETEDASAYSNVKKKEFFTSILGKNESHFKRIGKKSGIIILGFILFMGALYALLTNEWLLEHPISTTVDILSLVITVHTV